MANTQANKKGASAAQLKQVWSCGGGTQSCAIAALILQGLLPKPDIAVIADTGKECQATWDYVDEIIAPALDCFNLHLERISAADWSYYHRTRHELFNAQGTLQIPAYSNLSGRVSKLPGYCSSAWKQEPIDRWLRDRGVSKSDAVIWIGYGREEQTRWVKKMASEDFQRGLVRLPLVHDVPLSRQDCYRVIKEMGWPTPAPKSRCWMCPHQSDSEWRELSRSEFTSAVNLERKIRERDPHAFLHRSCVALDKVDFSQPEDLFTRPCDNGNCFV